LAYQPPTNITFLSEQISHQPTVLFSQNKSATGNQPTVLFSQNKSASDVSHQPNEHGIQLRLVAVNIFLYLGRGFW
jgi:hypothetical protein